MSNASPPVASTASAAVDDQLDAEPAECTECGRPLKRPSVDGLGPMCRRKLRAARAEQEGEQQ